MDNEDARHADNVDRTVNDVATLVANTIDAMLVDHDHAARATAEALVQRSSAFVRARADRRDRLLAFAQQHQVWRRRQDGQGLA